MAESLSGLKVLELATFIAGPYCTMTLADHGADVIKIERPVTGDENRAEPPFIGGESAPFMLWNRNKRSVVLDLKTEEGRANFLSLVDTADVVVENYRPGTMDRLGLGWDTLKHRNSRLIYGAVSGYGRTGTLSRKGGFDLVMQGLTGLMALTGPIDGPPHRMPIPICDIAAALHLTIGVLLALQVREQSGRGQLVETSLFEAGLSLQLYEAAAYFATGETPPRLGQKHRAVAPYQVYQTQTGHITIGVAHQNFWVSFCKILDRPDLVDHPKYSSNADRVANADSLAEVIEQILALAPSDYWIARLDQAGIPCGEIQTTDRALAHPHAAFREMVVPIDHPVAGSTRTLGIPTKLSDTPGKIRRPAPLLGEHSAEIIAKLATRS